MKTKSTFRNHANNFLTHTKGSRGITLIALVITIIVLLILAAVSIATLTGENGILTQATKAGERTTEETEKEELKLSYNAAKSKKYEEGDYTGEITAKDVEDELKKQNPKVQVKESSNPIEVTFPNGNVYTVDGKTGEIKGPTNTQGQTPTPPEEEKLAKKVLQINTEAGADVPDYERSPYVKYNGILCRVFYNDTEHGLQIISADNIKTKDSDENDIEEKITLGKDDSNVQATDFDYEGDAKIDDNFKRAALSYNRAVGALNDKAKTYKEDDSGIVIDARSLGSKAILNEDRKFQLDDTAPMYPSNTDTTYEDYITTYNWNGKLKTTDTNYEEDVGDVTEEKLGQLQKLDLNATSTTWLASRYVGDASNGMNFGVRYVNSGGMVRYNSLCSVSPVGDTNSYGPSFGFRPVFLLSSDVKITGGDGQTENTAYTLGK